MPQGKQITGEKYIYLAMAHKLANENGKTNGNEKSIQIGDDNGMRGGQNFYRRFTLMTYQDQLLLIEKKISANFADFQKVFLVKPNETTPEKPYIYEYIDENGDNGSKTWYH